MKSKIIKISIILIFMLFSAGLFNFCFATITQEDFELLSEYTQSENIIRLTHLKKEFNDFSLETCNSISHLESYLDRNNCDNGLSDVNLLYTFNLSLGKLYCAILTNKTDFKVLSSNSGFQLVNNTYKCTYFEYDWDTGKWTNNTGTFSTSFSSGYYIVTNKSTATVYHNNDYVFNPEDYNIPSEEEIKQQFDFKINIDFNKKLDNDTYIDRTSGYSALITHSLVGWENYYKVEVDITNSQTGFWNIWSNRYYLDYYDKNNNLLKEKLYLKGEGNTNWYHFNLEEGDYFTIFSKANHVQLVTLYYKIYNKSDNTLLASRKISFMFDTDYDPIRETLSGHIAFDDYLDSEGNDISENKDNVTTNGVNKVEQEFTQDSIDNVLNNYNTTNDLNSLVTNAKDTVNVFQICFNMLPSFVWVMIGTFLTVVIALRILGR